MGYASLELNMARGLHIPPGTIYRKMPYLKLLLYLHILDLEEQERKIDEVRTKHQEMSRKAPENFRRGKI